MKKFVFVFAIALLSASCARKEEVQNSFIPKVFHASIEESTRTYTEGGKVYWINGDKISLFDHSAATGGGVEYSYTGETGTLQGDFTTTAPASAPGSLAYNYAVYPYASWNELSADGIILTYIDPSQIYAGNTFGYSYSMKMGVNVMAAVSENETLLFRNLCGFLKLRLYGSGTTALRSVTVKSNDGEYIAGDIKATLVPGAEPVVVPFTDFGYAVSSASVSFTGENPVYPGASEASALELWFALTPGTISGGITVTATDENGSTFSATSTNPLAIKRGVCTTAKALEVVFPEVDEHYLDAYTGTYTFNTTSPWEEDGLTGDLSMLAYDNELGNVVFYGSIDGNLQTIFGAQCDVDGTITVPYGQKVGTCTYQGTEYDVCIVVAGLSGSSYQYYDADLLFSVTAEHKMTYTYGTSYPIGLMMVLDGTPRMWYDVLTVNSIVYSPSASVSSFAAAGGYDVSSFSLSPGIRRSRPMPAPASRSGR